ncbi:MAG TPA: hypothetical protein ENJ08_17325 [Gammaproteobacteria bacterium]|nr:hypothetical protein [Gammaproteobacteria bacterium]
MHEITNGCIEVLEQSEVFLQSSTPESYTNITKPYFISSCGEHMRHILDHFNAIKADFNSGTIDYDARQRGSDIETSIHCAQNSISEIKNWLRSLDSEHLNKALHIQTEVSVSEKHITRTPSCLGRELVFASTHAVHHYSMMSVAMQMQDLTADRNFGIAPATQTYLETSRDKNNTCAP